MASSVEWIFRMIDRVSGPARTMDARLAAVEATIKRVEGVTKLSGGAFGGWARQGETAARKVETALTRVQKRVEGVTAGAGRRFGGFQNAALNASLAAAPLVGVGYAGKQIVDAAAYKQDQLITFRGMLGGNQALAARIFGQAQAYAAATPFTTEQIIDATRTALSILPRQGAERNALPLVDLAGKLSAGSGQSMEQTMFAFQALLGGDFGQAFGVGQGFSNLNITRAMLRQAGLKFDKQGSYQGTVQEGLNAVAKITNETFGTALADRGQSLSGLASTIGSRPKELFMSLMDDRGQSRALGSLQAFMGNLADLTDFSKPPGSKIQARFEQSMTKLFGAVFGPLADATQGDRGVAMIDRLLDKVDEFSTWWTGHGPGLIANVRGFGEGLKLAADGATTLLRPLTWIMEQVDRHSGGSGQGMLGKLLGVGAGAVAIGKIGNMLSFGLLGRAGAQGGRLLFGSLKTAAQSVLTRGLLGEILTNPAGLLAGARAAFAGLGGAEGLGAVAATGTKALPVIGWIITGATILKTLGDQLYDHWTPFAGLIDSIKGKLDWFLKPADQQTSGLGRFLATDWLKKMTGQPQAWEQANTGFMDGLGGVASRLGIDPGDLLKVMNLESGVNPGAVYKNRAGQVTAAGLIQFQGATAQELGTSLDALRGMTREQQLPFVEKYLKAHGVTRGMGLEQLYMAVLSGSATNSGVLWTKNDPSTGATYAANAGLDTNTDGIITSTEATQKVESAWQRDKGTLSVTLTQNFSGSPDPAAVDAAHLSARQFLDSLAREHGFGGATP